MRYAQGGFLGLHRNGTGKRLALRLGFLRPPGRGETMRRTIPHRLRSVFTWHRPLLECLEERLPPGSLLLGNIPSGADPLAEGASGVSASQGLGHDLGADVRWADFSSTNPRTVAVAAGEPSSGKSAAATSPWDFATLDAASTHVAAPAAAPDRSTKGDTGVGAVPVSAPGSHILGSIPALVAGATGNGGLFGGVKNTPANGKSSAAQAYGRLPLMFEANHGQTDPRVDFLARGPGYTAFLTSTEAVLNYRPSDTGAAAVVQMQLVGSRADACASGQAPLSGKVNYLIGNDPSQWHTNVPTYGRVTYASVYSGIDLVYYSNGPQLEYDFVVAPGADPSAIKLRFQGAEGVQTDAQGDLVVQTAAGPIVQHQPTVYQQVGTDRQAVAGGFTVNGAEVGFQFGAYDHTRPLVIDPVILTYSTYLGGTAGDQGFGIGVGYTGSAYITGRTGSVDFPTTPGAFQTSHSAGNDAFVARMTDDGSGLVYATYLGGSLDDYGQGVVVDRTGNAFVVGATASNNFPVTPGAFQTTNAGNTDSFVAELAPNGASLLYSTFLGGSGIDQGNAIDVNRSTGVVYVTGGTTSTNFPITPGAFQSTPGGGADVFVTALNATGKGLVYSTYLGGADEDRGNGIAVDGLGRVSLTGQTRSTNFPTKAALQGTFGGGNFDAFVSRLTPDGSALYYSTYLGGSADDIGNAIVANGVGKTFITGRTGSSNFPTTAGAAQTVYGGGANDAFATSLAPDGASLAYSTFLGGSGDDRANGVAIDPSGRAYVAGFTGSTNFPVTSDAFQTTYGGGTSDVFVTKLASDGTSFAFSTYLGGSGADLGNAVALDRNGAVYVTGNTISGNFPVTSGAFQKTKAGADDAFVAKITATPGVKSTARVPAPLLSAKNSAWDF
jgi:hypothetical protein